MRRHQTQQQGKCNCPWNGTKWHQNGLKYFKSDNDWSLEVDHQMRLKMPKTSQNEGGGAKIGLKLYIIQSFIYDIKNRKCQKCEKRGSKMEQK